MNNSSLPHKKRRNDGGYTSKHLALQSFKDLSDGDRSWHSDQFGESPHSEASCGRAGGQPSDDVSWEIQINLIGCKKKSPMIHVCEICSLPILSYGRMIPCKHVFCFSCAKNTDNNCPRCKESMQRIEQCPLGSVWLCAASAGCRRTYLSQRDLQAHINHRHNKPPPTILPQLVLPPVSSLAPPITVPPPPLIQPSPLSDPYLLVQAPRPTPAPTPVLPPSGVGSTPRPSSNLITIQIQDSDGQSFPPPPPPGRPPNQPLLFHPQPQVDPHRYQ